MNILIVENHVLLREGLVSLFSFQPDLHVIGDVGTGCEAILKAVELKPDVVLLDVNLPDMSGFFAAKAIHRDAPESKIVMLDVNDTDENLLEAIKSGAMGYLNKNTPNQKLMASIRSLERGEAALSRSLTGRMLKQISNLFTNQETLDDFKTLTHREIEILRLIAKNASNKEIAEALFLSENTIKVHVHNLYQKLGLRRRRDAVKYARQKGLT